MALASIRDRLSIVHSDRLKPIAAGAAAVAARARPGEYAEIHSDSRLAIFAALGVSRKKSGNHKKRKAKHKLDETLVVNARLAYQKAQAALGHRIVIRKVKGHSGDQWNEVADALAAVGRTIAKTQQPCTAELIDRLQRAIDGIGGDEPPDIACHGFTMA